jgi:hypothetical protein
MRPAAYDMVAPGNPAGACGYGPRASGAVRDDVTKMLQPSTLEATPVLNAYATLALDWQGWL